MEVQNYEQLRNQTLLFFLERLLERERSEAGGGRRSLHDLSCQFGTKGFSKEMRQIAGGSKVRAGINFPFPYNPSHLLLLLIEFYYN